MYTNRLLVVAEVILVVVGQHSAHAQRRSHIGEVAVTLSETGAGTISIGGNWGLDRCAPHRLTPTIRDRKVIDLAIDIPDGDILCAQEDRWFLTEDFQFVDEDGTPFHPSQLQVDASFYVDNVNTGVRHTTSGPFSVYEEPPRSPLAYRMRGDVLESISLVSPDFELPPQINAKLEDWGVEIVDARAEFYLKVNAIDDWSFSLSLLADDLPLVTHVVSPSTSLRHITKHATDIDPHRLQISFADSHGLFERFDLDIDLERGTGTWDWFSDCPVCDLLYALPAANGTIHAIEQAPIFEFDCSLDGRVSYDDLRCSNEIGRTPGLLQALGLLPGDLNGDGSVDFPDFLVLAHNFGPHRRTYLQGDIDGDEKVGMSDFLILAENFNRSSPTAASVPEPACSGTLLLFALLLSIRRRGMAT